MTAFSDLIRVFGKIGLLSFGGPVAQIGVMHRELVERHAWLSDAAFTRGLSFAMLLPGPEAMQLCTYAGWRQRGVPGGLVAGTLFVLPGAVFMFAITFAYLRWGALPGVDAAFLGVKATVIVVVAQALVRIARKVLITPLSWGLAVAAFVALAGLSLPFPVVVLAAAAIGAVTATGTATETGAVRPRMRRTLVTALSWTLLWLAPLGLVAVTGPDRLADIAGFFTRLAAFSFGGAYAALAWMAQAMVEIRGWLTPEQMVDGLGLAETTPGPLILVTQFAGMVAAAPLGPGSMVLAALLSLWAIFIPCFGLVFTLAPYLDLLARAPRLAASLSAVSAGVVGVIAALALFFARHTLWPDMTLSPPALGLTALAALLLLGLRLPLPVTLIAMAIAAIGVAGALGTIG